MRTLRRYVHRFLITSLNLSDRLAVLPVQRSSVTYRSLPYSLQKNRLSDSYYPSHEYRQRTAHCQANQLRPTRLCNRSCFFKWILRQYVSRNDFIGWNVLQNDFTHSFCLLRDEQPSFPVAIRCTEITRVRDIGCDLKISTRYFIESRLTNDLMQRGHLEVRGLP